MIGPNFPHTVRNLSLVTLLGPSLALALLGYSLRSGPQGDVFVLVATAIFFLCVASIVAGGTLVDVLRGLAEAVADCETLVGRYNADDAFLLWCARQRATRPQGAYYKHLDPRLHHLFDAVGPEREVGLGNPDPHPCPNS